MTFDAVNPFRSIRAAYGVFIVTPFLGIAFFHALSWMILRLVPLFSASETLGVVGIIGQFLMFQALALLGASLPTWHWFQQLRESGRRLRGVTIVGIALLHYFVMLWWCALWFSALAQPR